MICTHYFMMRVIQFTRRYLADFNSSILLTLDRLQRNSPCKQLLSRTWCEKDLIHGKAILKLLERKSEMFEKKVIRNQCHPRLLSPRRLSLSTVRWARLGILGRIKKGFISKVFKQFRASKLLQRVHIAELSSSIHIALCSFDWCM